LIQRGPVVTALVQKLRFGSVESVVRTGDRCDAFCVCSPSPLALGKVKVGGIVREHGGD
jgi:hypothetical protein